VKIPKSLIPKRRKHVWSHGWSDPLRAPCVPGCACTRRECRFCGVEGFAGRTSSGMPTDEVRSTDGRTSYTSATELRSQATCKEAARAVDAIVATIEEELTVAPIVEPFQFGDAAGYTAWVQAHDGKPVAVKCGHDHGPHERGEKGATKCATRFARKLERERLKSESERQAIKDRIRAVVDGPCPRVKS
jgi:hypothetical protein